MKHFISFLSLCLVFNIANAQQSAWKNKVDASVLAKAEQGKSIDFIIVMKEQADVSGAKNLKTKEEKGRFVFNTLEKFAQRSQKSILDLLTNAKASFHAFYLVNAIYTKGDAKLMEQLASRADVKYLAPNPTTQMQMPLDFQSANELHLRQGVEWGIQKINADQVWELGYTGQGVVIAGQDTGYDWDHPAIKTKYRGWNGATADHNYNWHDAIHSISPLHGDSIISPSLNPCGLDSKVPCDDHSHGTHTMGTMVGEDNFGNQIGVAPDALWMAARNMERGYGSPTTYIECFEWFLAPTDLNNKNPNPSKAPHVINNSWGCPEMEGCNPSNWALMETAINNLRAAGVVVVQSAGNSGSSCSSIDDAAAIFEGAFSVGASQSNDTIAGFSSRGAVTADGSGRIKPNVVAPGVGVRSAVLGDGYAAWNGTSMAGPHVAGVVALLISANPELAGQVEMIETIIEQTAKPMVATQDCGNRSGAEIPNNTYGYGRIDALAAVQKALELATDVDSVSKNASIKIFPNPAWEEATLQLTGFYGEVEFTLFNATGQQVQRLSWDARIVSLKPINLKDLPKGVYFYQLASGGTIKSGKIVKQ
ncbi:MAG: S8 family serine peptidase [Saprospiraceae bacterium]|nr:S8 family serine peptidase [Saprospiraceae bacterium]